MTDLSHMAFGDTGPAMLVLHGLFGSARNWSGFARDLAANRRIFALDLRNHGRSPWTETMSYGEMAADVAEFADTRRLGPVAVLGHSMGGKVAMYLALERPDTVSALIVVDIAPVAYDHDMNDHIGAMQRLDLSGTQRRGDVEEALDAEIGDPAVTAFLMTNLERADGGFRWRVNLGAIAASMGAIVGSGLPEGRTYEGPVLFVAGSSSRYIRPEHRPRILELFPAARVVTLKDAGHWVHADQPAAFRQTVTAFLDALP